MVGSYTNFTYFNYGATDFHVSPALGNSYPARIPSINTATFLGICRVGIYSESVIIMGIIPIFNLPADFACYFKGC